MATPPISAREALNKAANAVALPSNPPEFAAWLAALLAPDRTPESREATFDAICEYFDPDEPAMEQGSQR